jgi:hypothetical protein
MRSINRTIFWRELMNHEITRSGTKQYRRDDLIAFVLFRVISWFNFSARQACRFQFSGALLPNRPVLVLLFASLLLLFAAAPANAQNSAGNLSAPVEPGARVTNLDLIRMVLPDVVEDEHDNIVAHKTTDLRNLLDKTDKPGSYEGEIKLDSFVNVPLSDGAHKDLCYLLSLSSLNGDDLFTWGDDHVLALFRLEPRPRLLDAAEVQGDRFAELSSIIDIGPHKRALIIANSHFNSSEGFLQLAVISATQDKLTIIYSYGGVEHTNACGYNFTMTPDITPSKQGRAAHYPLRLRVKLELMADDEGCEHRRRTRNLTRYYQAPLIWQPAKRRYVERGRGLAVVDKLEHDYLNLP